MSLTHSGAPEALQARVLISEAEKGYSNFAQFSNPAGGKSSEYQGVGFQIDEIGSYRLKPVIIARNVGSEPSNITVRVPYTRNDHTTGMIELGGTSIRAGEMKMLDVGQIVSRARQEQIKIAGIEIYYDTAPGSIIVNAHSQSRSGDQVFRVPMWDPFGQKSPTGGYPWRIENTSTTKTYIKNITDREQYYVAYLNLENGEKYTIGMKAIAAHQTVEIDVKNLRDEQVPDESGHVIPLNATRGQFKWSLKRTMESSPEQAARDGLALIGRTEQVDLEKGISSNYACINWCESSYIASYLDMPTLEIEVGETVDFNAFQNDMDHYGDETGYYQRFAINSYGPTFWASNQTSIATIGTSSSIATGVSVGTTMISATWQDYSAPQGTLCETLAENKKSRREQTSWFRGTPCEACTVFSVLPAPSKELTVTPTVNNVTSDSGTHKITNILGDQTLVHFVTPKGSGNITLTATLSENAQEILDDISWDVATVSSTNPLEASLSKGSASKNVVKIKYKNAVIKELRVWVVWSTITATARELAYSGVQGGTCSPNGPAVRVGWGYNFTHTIQPASIISDANRPNLSGGRVTAPPGTNHPITGDPLSGGATKKWDNSRQIMFKLLNSNNISINDTGFFFLGTWPNTITSYPANGVEGTDDTSDGEENNDPYANGGVLTGVDEPSLSVCDRAGANGNTLEIRDHFQEFTRLELEGTWYRISDYLQWRVHLRMAKTGTFWSNNSTVVALNNTGF